MELKEYARLVRDMRAQQRRFFNAPYGTAERAAAVRAAKPLENRVDRVTDEVLAEQPKLFGDAGA